MKKFFIALVMACVLCFTSLTFAAGPFADVPANHWAYGAISTLAKAGIIDGYGNGNFQGDKTMTRYEMAMVVGRAIEKEDKANAEQKALIEKLAAEFATELKNLGVRVKTLEDKTDKIQDKLDKVSVFGVFGTRYDYTNNVGMTDKSNVLNLVLTYKVNDQLSVVSENELHTMLMPTNNSFTWPPSSTGYKYTSVGTSDWQYWGLQEHVVGNFDGTIVKLGRFQYIPAYGIVHGNYAEVSGLLVSRGNTVKTTVVVGNDTIFAPMGTYASNTYKAADIAYAVNPGSNIKAAYQTDGVIHYLEGGFDTKVAKNLTFQAVGIRSSASSQNRGEIAELIYKGANPWIAQSGDFYVMYHNLQENSIVWNDIPLRAGVQALRVGGHYVFWKSSLLTYWYDFNGKYYNTSTNSPTFRAQLDLFF